LQCLESVANLGQRPFRHGAISYRFLLEVSGSPIFLPFEASSSIDGPGKFTKLVIFIRGSGRQAKLAPAMQAVLGVQRRQSPVTGPDRHRRCSASESRAIRAGERSPE
jgi:hypothetical protein